MEKKIQTINYGQEFVHHRILSAVRRADLVSNRMAHTAQRRCWCDIIVLNARAPTENKSDDTKDSFSDELDRAGTQSLSCGPHVLSAWRF